MKIETAKKVYNQAPSWYKEVLEDEFGKEKLIKREFTDIKTFDDACKYFGTTEEEFNLKLGDLLPSDTFAYEQLKLIVKAINQGWTPDWGNTNQRKWWPYFNLSSGFGFSSSSYFYGGTLTDTGSRLCFETEEKSNYAATQFLSIYEEFITVKK